LFVPARRAAGLPITSKVFPTKHTKITKNSFYFLTGLTGFEGLISNPAISPRRSEAVGNPINHVNPVENNSPLCALCLCEKKVTTSFVPALLAAGLRSPSEAGCQLPLRRPGRRASYRFHPCHQY
jgi:hypothetical protein